MGFSRIIRQGSVVTVLIIVVVAAFFLLKRTRVIPPTSKTGSVPIVSLPRVTAIEVDQLASATFRPGFKIRSLGPPNSGLFQEAKDAAINEFAHRIKLSAGRYNFEPAEDSAHPDLVRLGGSVGATQRISRLGGSVGVKLRIVDSDGNLFKEFTAIDTLSNEPSNLHLEGLQAWLIALPSRTLYRVEMVQDSVETAWKPEMGKELCVTFTYKLGEGYKAALGLFHELEN